MVLAILLKYKIIILLFNYLINYYIHYLLFNNKQVMNTNDKKLNKRKYESGALKLSIKNREALLKCANDKSQIFSHT